MSVPRQESTGCAACDLPPAILNELDARMGNPLTWPSTLFDGSILPKPVGTLNPRIRRWGALQVGMHYLEQVVPLAEAKHYPVPMVTLRRHYRSHLSTVGAEPSELIAAGIIEQGGLPVIEDAIDPSAYLRLYSKAIRLGLRGLDQLARRAKEYEDRGELVPMELVKMMLDNGVKLAASQAQITARGKMAAPDDDGNEGFRAGSEPLPSPRMGDHRVRVVDGEARAIVDRGPADREKFIERAAQQGYEAPVRTRG